MTTIPLTESGSGSRATGSRTRAFSSAWCLPTSKAVLATIGLYYAVSLWNAYFIPFIYLNDPDLFSLQLILHELLSAGSSNNATVGVGDVLVVGRIAERLTHPFWCPSRPSCACIRSCKNTLSKAS